MLLLRLFRPPPPTMPVKEVMDARPCRVCSRPTWSLMQVCVACKRGMSADEIAAIARRGYADSRARREGELADVEQILSFFPPAIHRRFVRRLFMEAFMVPPSVVIAVIATAAFVTISLGVCIVAMITYTLVSAIEPPFVQGILWTFLAPSFVCLPLAGTVQLTMHAFTNLRRQLAHAKVEWIDAHVRCRICFNCGYDQTGTTGPECPECACPVCFE